jgi:hypothetical protein
MADKLRLVQDRLHLASPHALRPYLTNAQR